MMRLVAEAHHWHALGSRCDSLSMMRLVAEAHHWHALGLRCDSLSMMRLVAETHHWHAVDGFPDAIFVRLVCSIQ